MLQWWQGKRKCDECGKKYTPNIPTQKYCDTTCAHRHKNLARNRERVPRHVSYYRKCIECLRWFITGYVHQTHCSTKCHDSDHDRKKYWRKKERDPVKFAKDRARRKKTTQRWRDLKIRQGKCPRCGGDRDDPAHKVCGFCSTEMYYNAIKRGDK